jgi:hypothetical protein
VSRDPLGEPGFRKIIESSLAVGNDGLNSYLFVGDNPVSRVDILGLWYDTTSNYFLQCTKLLTTKQRCGCLCAPITTGSDDSKKCEVNCEKCDDAIKGIAGGQAKADALCLCYCNLANQDRIANSEAPVDCAKACKMTCWFWNLFAGNK